MKSLKTIEETLTFRKKGVVHKPLKYWTLSNGHIVVIYQGSRGQRPDLDFVIKYLEPGKRLRSPSHTHWIFDIILKSDLHPEAAKDFINEWLEIYELLEPFRTIEERDNYTLIYPSYFEQKYSDLENLGKFSVEFVATIIELFVRCEKQTDGAFMFKKLLSFLKEYCEGKKDFYQIVSLSKRV